MVRAFYILIACHILWMGTSVPARGQAVDEPEIDPAPKKSVEPKEPIDPFDAKYRRTSNESDADLDVLKKHSLDSATDSLLAFLRARTLADGDREKVAKLVRRLGSPDFREREQATNDLLKIGPSGLEYLRAGSRDGGLELIRRADACIDRIRSGEPPAEVAAAVVRLLRARKPAGVSEALLAYLPYCDSDYVADEVRDALGSIAKRDAASHREIASALDSDIAVRRAAAGEALAGNKAYAEKVSPLLSDGEAVVRMRVARALVLSGDKSAVPILVESLPLVGPSQAWSGEEVLFRLAEGKEPPKAPRIGDDEAKKKYVASWLVWWAKNEKQTDLAKLHETPEVLGHTVMVLLDIGQILEVNAKNETLWQIRGVAFPLDVQLLDNGNVLMAEYNAGQVVERDRVRGEVKWKKEIAGPLVAQRLPNRNTFIATDTLIFELNEKGEEVYSFSMAGGEKVMKIAKSADGDIVALTTNSRIVRFDEKGKELSSFAVNANARLFGGRIQTLPNGRVLIPHHAEDKVVEYDSTGNIVWEASVKQPIAASRLPNGNTLVTTMQPETGAIELDRTGRESGWNYRHEDSRVTRAIRR